MKIKLLCKAVSGSHEEPAVLEHGRMGLENGDSESCPKFFQGRNFKKPQENNLKNSKKQQKNIPPKPNIKNPLKTFKKNPTRAVEKKP